MAWAAGWPHRLLGSLVASNAASNFFALGWFSLLSRLAIPVYIKLMDASESGLVAACASLQQVSNFVDAGWSPIVPRWVAREAQNPTPLLEHVALFRRLYLGLGLLVFTLLHLSAGQLAQSWLQVTVDRTGALENGAGAGVVCPERPSLCTPEAALKSAKRFNRISDRTVLTEPMIHSKVTPS